MTVEPGTEPLSPPEVVTSASVGPGLPSPAEDDDEPVPTLWQHLLAVLAVPGRLLGALLLPDRTLPGVVRRERIWAALIVCTALSLASALAIGARLDVSRGPQPMMQGRGGPGGGGGGEAEQAPSEREIEEQLAKQQTMQRVGLALRGGLGTPFTILLLGVGLYLLSRYVGGKPSMGRALSVAAHALLPQAVKAGVVAVAAWRQTVIVPAHIPDLQRVDALTVPPLDHPLLARLASGIDVFTVWSLVIIVFGLAAAAEMSRKKSLLTVLFGFAFFQLLAGGGAGGGGGAPGGPPTGGPPPGAR